MSEFKKCLKSLMTGFTHAVKQTLETAGQRIDNFGHHPYAWDNVDPMLMSLFSEQIDLATKHEFMAAAIAEAQQSSLYPTVGAVMVKDGKIIAQGHRTVNKICEIPPRWQVRHAEQNTLESAGNHSKGATLYVTLEPCAERFQGPTVEPAMVCSELITRAGISCVVVGLVDHDPMTCGKGLKHLQAAGIQLEYCYAGLEQDLLNLIGKGHFGVLPEKELFNS